MTSTSDSRRSQVMVGQLPDDFLQLPQSQQVAADAQTAAYMQYGGQNVVSGGFMPPNIRGKLSITVSQAKLNKNYGLMKMDPYCKFRVGHHVLETPTAQGAGKGPAWNKRIACYLPTGVDGMYIEIYDERTFTTDERVAWAHIEFAPELFQGETTDKWYTLSGRLGDNKEGAIHLVMSFADMSQVSAQQQQQPVAPPRVVMMPGVAPMMYQVVPPGYMVAGQPGMVQQQHVPVQQQGPMFTDEDVQQIQELFPSTEAEVIRSVLEANRGNKDATINSLLQMQSD